MNENTILSRTYESTEVATLNHLKQWVVSCLVMKKEKAWWTEGKVWAKAQLWKVRELKLPASLEPEVYCGIKAVEWC